MVQGLSALLAAATSIYNVNFCGSYSRSVRKEPRRMANEDTERNLVVPVAVLLGFLTIIVAAAFLAPTNDKEATPSVPTTGKEARSKPHTSGADLGPDLSLISDAQGTLTADAPTIRRYATKT